MYDVNGSVLSCVLHLGATYAKLLSHTKITIFSQCSPVCSREEVRTDPRWRVGEPLVLRRRTTSGRRVKHYCFGLGAIVLWVQTNIAHPADFNCLVLPPSCWVSA